MIDPSLVEHINLKVFLADPRAIDLADAIPVFHRWIRDKACPEMLVDVADYRHVPAGPGVMLIGHEANYSLDDRDGRLGLLYNRKAATDGGIRGRLEQAHRAAKAACERLEAEPVFAGKLKFDWREIEVFVNDRLLAPNTEETFRALKPELENRFPGYAVTRRGEPRDLFRVALIQGE